MTICGLQGTIEGWKRCSDLTLVQPIWLPETLCAGDLGRWERPSMLEPEVGNSFLWNSLAKGGHGGADIRIIDELAQSMHEGSKPKASGNRLPLFFNKKRRGRIQ
jgi:hypothetical protein